MPLPHRIALSLLPFLIAGCGAGAVHSHVGGDGHADPPPPPPDSGFVEDLEACKLPTEPDTELVFGLSPDNRAELKAALQRGPAAVRAEGCKLVVVSSCELRGSAAYTSGGKEAPAEVKDEAELSAMMPFFAGRIARAGSGAFPLHFTVVVAGKYEFSGATVTPEGAQACKEATHVVTAYGVGAFEVANKQGAIFEKAGDRAGCAGQGSAPPASCKELISVKLAPIGLGRGKDKSKEEKAASTGDVAKGPIGPPPKPIKLLDVLTKEEAAAGESGAPEEIELDTNERGSGHGRGGSLGGAARNACDPADPLCSLSRHIKQ